MIKPSHPTFNRLMNYWYYRLLNTSHVRLAGEFRKQSEQVKSFQATFRNTNFSREDPIIVFDFLSMFVEEASTLGVSEAHASLTLLKLLKSLGELKLQSICNGARSGGITCWPEASTTFFALTRRQRPFATLLMT